MLIVLLALVPVLLVLCGGGAVGAVVLLTRNPPATTGSSGTSDASQRTFPMGSEITMNSTDGTEADIKLSDPGVRGRDVVVSVNIAVHAGTLRFNPHCFLLTGPDGTGYDEDTAAPLASPLDTGEVPAGQSAHGQVGFAAPASVLHGGRVEMTDSTYTTIAYWAMS